MTTEEKATELIEWGNCENTEVGETWVAISDLYLFRSDYIGSSLMEALEVEIEHQHSVAFQMIENGEFELDEEFVMEE